MLCHRQRASLLAGDRIGRLAPASDRGALAPPDFFCAALIGPRDRGAPRSGPAPPSRPGSATAPRSPARALAPLAALAQPSPKDELSAPLASAERRAERSPRPFPEPSARLASPTVALTPPRRTAHDAVLQSFCLPHKESARRSPHNELGSPGQKFFPLSSMISFCACNAPGLQ